EGRKVIGVDSETCGRFHPSILRITLHHPKSENGAQTNGIDTFTEWTRLAELASKSPDAHSQERQRQGSQAEEAGPKIAETAALNQAPARNGRKVMDRVQDGQRPHPFRHALDRVQ